VEVPIVVQAISFFAFAEHQASRRAFMATVTQTEDESLVIASTLSGEDAELATLSPDHPCHPYLAELLAVLTEPEATRPLACASAGSQSLSPPR
jgi:hypothetical protein